MTTKLMTVSPETSVLDMAKLLVENRISGAPVVDAAGRLVGIVSESDLMFRRELATDRRRSWWQRLLVDPQTAAESFAKSHGLRAADVMTQNVHTVTEDTSIADVATMLQERRIKRVPVMRGDKMVGLISRGDLLRALAAVQPPAVVRTDDETLRNRVVEELRKDEVAAGTHLNIVVNDGVVHLWGFVDSDAERKAVRIAAEIVPGVTRVVDHLRIMPMGYGAT